MMAVWLCEAVSVVLLWGGGMVMVAVWLCQAVSVVLLLQS